MEVAILDVEAEQAKNVLLQRTLCIEQELKNQLE